MQIKTMEMINQTKEYLKYLEEHIKNVERAWQEVQHKCHDMEFMSNKIVARLLPKHIARHDLSKLSPEEFCQYRKSYFPCSFEISGKPFEAWDHHKENNFHHWETWTHLKSCRPWIATLHCVHMVIDWLAMSYKLNDTPRRYYEANKDKIKLPEWAVRLIYEIFDRLESTSNEKTCNNVYE